MATVAIAAPIHLRRYPAFAQMPTFPASPVAPAELMQEWTVRDVAAIGGTILYRLGFETGDIGRTADWLALQDHYAGVEHEALRRAMALELWRDVTPVYDFPSAPDFGTAGRVPVSSGAGAPTARPTTATST